VAPRIKNLPAAPVQRDGKGTAIVNLTCEPQVLKGQAVFLLLGQRQVPLQVVLPAPALRFIVADATPGTFFVRVRVDGVDSLLIDRRPEVPIFDQSQKVVIA